MSKLEGIGSAILLALPHWNLNSLLTVKGSLPLPCSLAQGVVCFIFSFWITFYRRSG